MTTSGDRLRYTLFDETGSSRVDLSDAGVIPGTAVTITKDGVDHLGVHNVY